MKIYLLKIYLPLKFIILMILLEFKVNPDKISVLSTTEFDQNFTALIQLITY